MELNVSRIKPKRERGHNWSTKEKMILFECVKDYLHIVSDCRNAVEVRKKKNVTWAWISKLAIEMGVFVNETLKIKTQWKRMRIAAKKSIHAYQNGLTIDGKMVVPSELDWNVYNAITNISINNRQLKSLDDNEMSLANEIKHENQGGYSYDNLPIAALQIPDDVYSIEDESVSSHSNVSIGSQTSNTEQTCREEKHSLQPSSLHMNMMDTQISQQSRQRNIGNMYQRISKSDEKLPETNDLDWNVYNAITNFCSEKPSKSTDRTTHSQPSEIKNELTDDYIFDNRSTSNLVPNTIKSSNVVCVSTGTQTSIVPQSSQGQQTVDTETQPISQLPKSLTDRQDKILIVQLKIEEAKLKEIEERIHQQRVIFELNKTLLQKQIENESVKKYNM